jgi:hypothetical protein
MPAATPFCAGAAPATASAVSGTAAVANVKPPTANAGRSAVASEARRGQRQRRRDCERRAEAGQHASADEHCRGVGQAGEQRPGAEDGRSPMSVRRGPAVSAIRPPSSRKDPSVTVYTSKNASRRWCSMAHCGTEAKVRATRARRRAARAAA